MFYHRNTTHVQDVFCDKEAFGNLVIPAIIAN